MADFIRIQKDVPVVDCFDAVVCGGGPAGFVAAISAARTGLKTALVERHCALGGAATAGLVIPISGFFHHEKRVVGGIAWEFVQRLIAFKAAQVEYPKGHVSFHPETYKLVAQQMVLESGVFVYCNTLVSGAKRQEGRVTHVLTESKTGTQALQGKVFIDATGEADVCRFVNAPMQRPPENLQPLSLCFLLEGVDQSTPLLKDSIHQTGQAGRPSVNEEIRAYLAACVQAGRLKQFGGPWFNTLVMGNAIAVNVTRLGADAADRDALCKAEQALREDMFTIVSLLRERYAEFRGASIVSSGVTVGVRETRRIQGVQTVTGEDLLKGRTYACPVARCAHPMDIHYAGGFAQELTPLKAPAYVPHTALLPKGFDNLIAVGRCVSADPLAYASLRVQATVMAMGESAGVMAARSLQEKKSVAHLDEQALKAALAKRQIVL